MNINTWFCSDHHFGHKNILEYEKEARPFSSVEEMNETIIERHNNVVKPQDTVYFLGDFAFGKKNIELAGRMNGKKRLVMGNHDTYPTADYLKFFEKLYGVVFWERCILSHVPVHHNGINARWILNVHGHLHSKKVKISNIVSSALHMVCDGFIDIDEYDQNYYNVSLEQNNLTPIHRDIITERLKEIKNEI